jgi:beta-phosphoglucomutase-like phosphatase (HAD superfamily)
LRRCFPYSPLKTRPEIFLAACAGLNVRPDAAIGIEDAPAGVAAINAAGMLSVGIGWPEPCGITTSFNAGTDLEMPDRILGIPAY